MFNIIIYYVLIQYLMIMINTIIIVVIMVKKTCCQVVHMSFISKDYGENSWHLRALVPMGRVDASKVHQKCTNFSWNNMRICPKFHEFVVKCHELLPNSHELLPFLWLPNIVKFTSICVRKKNDKPTKIRKIRGESFYEFWRLIGHVTHLIST
jgi:hypothetical protein